MSEDACPITLVPTSELEIPVAFKHNPSRLYECAALVRWLKIAKTDPMTNLPVSWLHHATEILIAPCAAAEPIIDQLSAKFMIVGTIPVSIHGVALNPGLQNLLSHNWPNPPLAIDRLSYVYVSGETIGETFAAAYGAKFRQESVYTDGNRVARLIYHSDNAHTTFGDTINCLLVLETTAKEDEKWFHLVHVPSVIMPSTLAFSQ